jgi:AraC-like DNA-binding protein/mannose-6-phosphate isomerase-like protein (cupin superfamily)
MGLRINRAGRIRVPPDWTLTPQRTRAWSDLVLWHLVGGRGQVTTQDRAYDLTPGVCLVMRGGSDYTFAHEPRRPFVHYWVHYELLETEGDVQDHPAPPFYRMIPDRRIFEALLDRLVEAYRGADQGGQKPQQYLPAVLAEIRRADRIAAARSGGQNTGRRWQAVDQLCRRINEQPQDNWTVEDIAEALSVSRSQAYRCFVQRTGRSPQAFVIEARMRWARSMLLNSDNRISWIADQLGYRDVYFFSRQFKQANGSSPSTFRNTER